VVDRTQDFPSLAVHVEPAEGVVAGWGGFVAGSAAVAALAARVGERLRGHLGLNPEIAIVPPKTIPRSEGKAVRVVERR
jgi:phenylacetate-CoA ligase